MAKQAHEKRFFLIRATIQNYKNKKFHISYKYCGRIFADKINGLGIGFKRALLTYPKDDIVKVDLMPMGGVLPIPRTQNLCNGCRTQGNCTAMGAE